MAEDPISARIVVSTEEFGGLSGGDSESSSKKTNQLLNKILKVNEKNFLSSFLSTGIVGNLLRTIAATGVVAGGITKGITTIGDALQAMDPVTGKFDPSRVLSEEDFQATADALKITKEEAMAQANSQETITADTRTIQEKMSDTVIAIEDTPELSRSMNESFGGVITALDALKNKIANVKLPKIIPSSRYIIGESGIDVSTTAGVLEAINYSSNIS